MQRIAVDLTMALEINRADGIQDSRGMIASRISDLTSMTRIVEEIDSSRFGNKPVYRCLGMSVEVKQKEVELYKNVSAIWIIRAFLVICQDDLGVRVI